MTATGMQTTLIQLQQHVRYYMAREHDADEHELVDHFLDALDLDPNDYLAILEEYRRRKRIHA
jgi:phosphoglucomutase